MDDSFNGIAERLAKRRRIGDPSKDYIDCSLILGSSAEVERVFSMGKNVLAPVRHAMTPQIFEALLFLSYNRLWDEQLVSEAIGLARSSRNVINSTLNSSVGDFD